jgi:ribosome biogenesis GTPase A
MSDSNININSNINWFPGHMAKAKREIIESLKKVDIAFLLFDSRIPYSSLNPMLDEILGNKPRLILLNKANVADKSITKEWMDYYKNKGYIALDIDSISGYNVNKITQYAAKALTELFKKREVKGIKSKEIKAMILGIPNVGKSTLINKLAKRKALNVGDKPGVTKAQSMVRVSDDLILYDTPGVLWPKFEDQEVGIKLAICSSIRDEILDLEYLTLYALNYLVKNYKDLLEKRYEINIESEDPNEILDLICVKKGCLLKGGLPDRLRASKMIINDIRNVRIGAISFEKPE